MAEPVKFTYDDNRGLQLDSSILGLRTARETFGTSNDKTTGSIPGITQETQTGTNYLSSANTLDSFGNTNTGTNTKIASANEVPQATTNTPPSPPPTGDNTAAGQVGAIFNMVNEVIGGVSTIMQLFGLDDKSRTQKDQWQSGMDETKRRFDTTFFENVRQFNTEYALKEFATRKGLQMQEVQQLWNMWTEGRVTDQNLRLARLNEEKGKFDFDREKEAYNNKIAFKKSFMKSMVNLLGNRSSKVYE